jgi:Putative restriction endonuclease
MTGLLTNAQRSYPFDVRQFHRMMAAGIFDDQKVELVAGIVYAMSDLPSHTFAVGRLHEALRVVLPRDEWTVREEKPVLIGRYWAPKPDVAVLRESDAIYSARHPPTSRCCPAG